MKYLIVLGRLFHCVLNALQKNFFIETEIKLTCNGGIYLNWGKEPLSVSTYVVRVKNRENKNSIAMVTASWPHRLRQPQAAQLAPALRMAKI